MPEFDPPRHETSDFHPRVVRWFAIALTGLLVGVFVAVRIFESILVGGPPATAPRILAPQVEIPQPRLQTNPAADLAEWRAVEERKLKSYGWIDRKAGFIRLPIERAMELTLERGLPAREQGRGAAP